MLRAILASPINLLLVAAPILIVFHLRPTWSAVPDEVAEAPAKGGAQQLPSK